MEKLAKEPLNVTGVQDQTVLSLSPSNSESVDLDSKSEVLRRQSLAHTSKFDRYKQPIYTLNTLEKHKLQESIRKVSVVEDQREVGSNYLINPEIKLSL